MQLAEKIKSEISNWRSVAYILVAQIAEEEDMEISLNITIPKEKRDIEENGKQSEKDSWLCSYVLDK